MKSDLPIILIIALLIYFLFNIRTKYDHTSFYSNSTSNHYTCGKNISLSCLSSDKTCNQLKSTCKSLFLLKKYSSTLKKQIQKKKGYVVKQLFNTFGCRKNLENSFYKKLKSKYKYIYKDNISSNILKRIKKKLSSDSRLQKCKYIH